MYNHASVYFTLDSKLRVHQGTGFNTGQMFQMKCVCPCVCVCFQALREWVAIESDSSNVLKRPDLHHMMEMVAQKLRLMGGNVELVDIGEQEVSDVAPHCLS